MSLFFENQALLLYGVDMEGLLADTLLSGPGHQHQTPVNQMLSIIWVYPKAYDLSNNKWSRSIDQVA